MIITTHSFYMAYMYVQCTMYIQYNRESADRKQIWWTVYNMTGTYIYNNSTSFRWTSSVLNDKYCQRKLSQAYNLQAEQKETTESVNKTQSKCEKCLMKLRKNTNQIKWK